jgi:undecaprenyl-diphosphatase
MLAQLFDWNKNFRLNFPNNSIYPAVALNCGPQSVCDDHEDPLSILCAITALGGPSVLTLLTVAVSLFLALDGKKHMALFVCGSVGSGLLVSTLLQDSFDRPRPDIVPHEVYAASYSFPSGHSMLSALTYLTLGAILARAHERKLLKAYFLLTAVFLTVLIGVTRVYLGVHWPTDVLAGWTAGAVWALLCWLLARWLQRRRTLEPEADH